MILNCVYTCFCPRIIDEDEIKRDSSDDSIATILPFGFIPENEFNHHPVLDRARTPTRGAGIPSPSATHRVILLLVQLPIILQ